MRERDFMFTNKCEIEFMKKKNYFVFKIETNLKLIF